jgi:hypothetical protein
MNWTDTHGLLWKNHESQPQVCEELLQELISGATTKQPVSWTNESRFQLCQFLMHFYCDHQKNPNAALLSLQSLGLKDDVVTIPGEIHPVLTFECTLKICISKNIADSTRMQLSPEEQAFALAQASGYFASISEIQLAIQSLQLAIEIEEKLEKGIRPKLVRALAVRSNNLASIIEQQNSKRAEDQRAMIQFAHSARHYWELAGTWLEIERAEYRLCKSFASIGDYPNAHKHAQNCLRICKENQAPAFELFYAHEAILGLISISGSSVLDPSGILKEEFLKTFQAMTKEDQDYCQPDYDRIVNRDAP